MNTPLYKQADADIERRIDDLLSRMTLEEKAAQLTASMRRVFDNEDAFAPGENNSDDPFASLRNGIGHISRMGESNGAAETARNVNSTQRFLVEQTRLGIPAIIHEECLHGLMQDGATLFPQSIAMGSSWDPDLVEEVFSAIALETRSRGCTQALTPNLDVMRDPRYGRTEESYGEDPYLVSRFGVAMVKGFQGDGPIIARDRIIATGKHFAAAGEPSGGLNCGEFTGSERIVREICLPSFEAAVKEGGLQSIMAAYNGINGVPCHVNRWLLTDVLRDEWGFDGVVVSDYGALVMLQKQHGVAADAVDAASQGLNAGMDVELPGAEVYTSIPEALEQGTLTPDVVDESVRRVLRLKFRLGLFENPYADEAEAERVNHCEEHRALALKAAERSIVLLKNNNNRLPLDAGSLQRIAVIGPNAAKCCFGSYSVTSSLERGISILEGIRAHVGDSVAVDYSEGCRIHLGNGYWREPEAVLNDPADDRRMIAEAVTVAEAADVAVVVVGGDGQTCRESFEPRIGDRSDLSLMGLQDELVQAIHATGTPTIVVMINGRPLAICDIAEQIDAVVEGWYLGEETGTAMANMLFGKVNPGGKLSFSFPRSAGHVPCYYNKTKMSLERRYIHHPNTPLFSFGHGLSYTTFEISDPILSSEVIPPDGETTVTVSVTNTGDRAGDEVVQLYIRDCLSSVIRPAKELKGFQRVSLEPGESRDVSFTLGFDQLSIYNRAMERCVEPGEFTIMVGPNSEEHKICPLTVQ
jgi:beta-glucosidase